MRIVCRSTYRDIYQREGKSGPLVWLRNQWHEFRLGNRTIEQAKANARDFIDRYPFVDAGLLFVGPSGRGKTHLACAILSELASTKGVHGMYVDFSDLLLRIQTSFRPDADASKELVLTPFVETELLVLDDPTLGLDVVAEGVETQADAAYLRSIGCEYGQGFLFARPAPAQVWIERLAPV